MYTILAGLLACIAFSLLGCCILYVPMACTQMDQLIAGSEEQMLCSIYWLATGLNSQLDYIFATPYTGRVSLLGYSAIKLA